VTVEGGVVAPTGLVMWSPVRKMAADAPQRYGVSLMRKNEQWIQECAKCVG